MTSLAGPPDADELETSARRPPLQRHLTIQSDQFCRCGYNLYGQTVTFDERLGFPVVRCPECGNWHPAGHGSTALRPWLARLAVLALALWVALLLAAGLAIAGALVGFQFAFLEVGLSHGYVDLNTGRPIESQFIGGTWEWVYLDTGAVANLAGPNLRFEMIALPQDHPLRSTSSPQDDAQRWRIRAFLLGFVAVLGIVAGAIQSGVMWHMRGLRSFVAPVVVLGLAAAIFWLAIAANAVYYQLALGEAVSASLAVLGLAALAWLVGMTFGRPVLRVVVTGLVPPRPRQMLAFLWLADGKPAPGGGEPA